MLSKSAMLCSKMPFPQHTLIIFSEKRKKTSSKTSSVVNPCDVDSILGLERNEIGQIYSVPNLDICLHGTVPTHKFTKYVSRRFPSQTVTSDPFPKHDSAIGDYSSASSPRLSTSSDSRMVEYLFAPSQANFVSLARKIAVINDGRKWTSKFGKVTFWQLTTTFSHSKENGESHKSRCLVDVTINDPIAYCAEQIRLMFVEGMCTCFAYEKSKRSGGTTRPNSEVICAPGSVSIASFLVSNNSVGTASKSQKRRDQRQRNKQRKMNKDKQNCLDKIPKK